QPNESIRAAASRRVRSAAGIARSAPTGRHGEPAGRSLVDQRAQLGRRAGDAQREAALVREGGAASGPEDGASHSPRADDERSPDPRPRGTNGAQPVIVVWL